MTVEQLLALIDDLDGTGLIVIDDYELRERLLDIGYEEESSEAN